ncbi:hypothetical protein [Methylobrevis pamukkalensis]|uniref:Eukaryotic DNA topoisomerase I, catalytic core n=1 Tax=Methylobrevis pamukkalensis TaxID=1439726 RepID=A0A1E3H064_9HYPH|nr:hypothetical protein [Methylobrevis pamukkalensis]ODN69565.1 Eukaryotic DNA topoisomerase I, catalytic core [Methylobrevis pamukkalensis]
MVAACERRGLELRFAFVGKSGREWSLQLADRRIARLVSAIDDLPGRQLFQYLGDDGTRRPVQASEVNDYIRARPAATSPRNISGP